MNSWPKKFCLHCISAIFDSGWLVVQKSVLKMSQRFAFSSPSPPSVWETTWLLKSDVQVYHAKKGWSFSFQFSDVILFWEPVFDLLQLADQLICILYASEKETLLDHLPSDITLKSGWGTSVHWQQCLKAQQVFHIFKSCYITKLICLHIMILPDLQTFFSLLPIYMVIFKNTVIATLLLSDSAYFSRVSQNVLC